MHFWIHNHFRHVDNTLQYIMTINETEYYVNLFLHAQMVRQVYDSAGITKKMNPNPAPTYWCSLLSLVQHAFIDSIIQTDIPSASSIQIVDNPNCFFSLEN